MTAKSGGSAEILVSIDEDCATVTLARPEVRNAQTPDMWRQLSEIALSMPASVRFVVLAGQGKDFSAGLDRNALAGPMIAELQRDPHAFISAAQEGFRAWSRIPQTVIALVQGNAIGAGFQLALASDLIIATPEARFAMRETSIGLVPDLGGTGALVDALGYRRAFALCATGDFIGADEAHRCGIVHRVTDSLEGALADLLEHLRAIDAGAIADVKSLLRSVARDQDSWSREREVQVQRLATLFGAATS